MPAVTADTLTLPRIERPLPTSTAGRPVLSLTTAPGGLEGEGFPVHRAFAGVAEELLDPFVHMDQMGEVDYAPGEPKGTPWHPHRGFETVTYIMDGTFVHQDSAGGGGSITDGDTQWMTAGAGILHIETPPESLVVSGGLFHGIQLWVNLPRAKKMTAPRYQDIGAGNQVLLASHDGGALVRLIAGDLGGHGGSAQTHTPMTMLHGTVSPGSELVLPWPAGYNALVYGLSGYGSVGPDRRPFRLGQLAALGGGDTITVAGPRVAGSDAKPLDVLILGGRPLREPVAKYGPFVMNTAAEVQTAFDDFRAGRLGRIPADHISR